MKNKDLGSKPKSQHRKRLFTVSPVVLGFAIAILLCLLILIVRSIQAELQPTTNPYPQDDDPDCPIAFSCIE